MISKKRYPSRGITGLCGYGSAFAETSAHLRRINLCVIVEKTLGKTQG
jgi:hypothetical protein